MCFNVLIKDVDWNLVDGRIIDDLNDLPSVLHNLSDYICKKYLTLVEKLTDLKATEVKRHILSLDCIVSGEIAQMNVSMKQKHPEEHIDVLPS